MYKELGHSKIGFRQLGSDHFRPLAVSDGGSGGGGSGNSGSGGGSGGVRKNFQWGQKQH